ncbi:vacuolar protein sorting protein 18 [Pelomyxa schiedti]|nr:vacuolar protein sorting protein 18 [Pelomyxa schiedti]
MADDNFQGFDAYGATGIDDNLEPEIHTEGADGMPTGDASAAAVAEEPQRPQMFQVAKLASLAAVPLHTKGLITAALSNDILVLACHNKNIVHIDLRDSSGRLPVMKDFIVPTPRSDDSQINKIFLDPTGYHLIISLESDENYYFNSSYTKAKYLPRCKGVKIESVAWDLQNTDPKSTKEILVGTSQGKVFEACIDSTSKDLAKDMTWNKLYPLDNSTSQAITGLRWERCPEDKSRYFVIATTTSRFYQFIGGPTFEAIFQHQEGPKFTEIPQGVRLQNAELCFFCKYRRANASHFAWLTGPGIYHGKISFGFQGPGDIVTADTSLIHYPVKDTSIPADPPLGMALTEFHYLLVYDQMIQCVNSLTDEPVFELELSPKCGKIHCILRDMSKEHSTILICATNLIYEMLVIDEDRDVWKQKMEQKEWQSAIDYCKGDPEKQDIVWTAQAEHYFATEQYDLSALSYAKTRIPFEKVALKFINKEKRSYLLRYLTDKLATLNPQHKMQITAICTWVTELYLHKLNLQEGSSSKANVVMDEFKAFLDKYKESLNVETTFSLIAAHGRTEDMLRYAFLIEDYERLLSYFLQLNAFKQAISVMMELTQAHETLFYKFSPVIICHEPVDLVTCWISSKVVLQPKQLFPALMRYDPTKFPKEENQAVRYLEFCIRTNHDPAVHNYLLSLYAQQEVETSLQRFLNETPRHYDSKYALRLCTKLGKKRACVVIYSNMNMHEEAVDLALGVDIGLAKMQAQKPEDEALKKRLWLKIAKYVVENSAKSANKNANIKYVMSFLRECENLLKIEDILPFFPEFTVIDDFKEEICRSLDEYNKHIAALKDEMAEATKSANLIRKDIGALRNKCGVVPATQQCEICHCPALAKQFFYFPCRHVMHADCLHTHMIGFLTPTQRQRALDLKSILACPPVIRTGALPGEQDDAAIAAYERAKQEYDDLIASECPLCGEIMISQTAEPFYALDDDDLLQKWKLGCGTKMTGQQPPGTTCILVLTSLCASVTDEWAVCTLEGLIALTKDAVLRIQPPYVELQHMTEAMVSTLEYIERNPSAEEQLLWKSYMSRMTILTSGPSAGSASDFAPDRVAESAIVRRALKPVLVNRTAPCPCNPYWLDWISANYLNTSLGVSCERFCKASKQLALGRHLATSADVNTKNLKYIPKMWASVTNVSLSIVVTPWANWRSTNLTIVEYSRNPDYMPPSWGLVWPENDPDRSSKWSEPYYPVTEMMIQVLAPLYSSDGEFISAVTGIISMADTCKIMESIHSTPNGFSLLLSKKGYILSANTWVYAELFGPSFNFTVRSQPSLSAAIGWDFTELLDGLESAGTTTIDHNGTTWIYSRQPLDLLPWTVVIAVPQSDILSNHNFTVTPEVLSADVRLDDLPVSFNIFLQNSGHVPLVVDFSENMTHLFKCNITQNVTLGGSETVTIQVTYIGNRLPYIGSITISVVDAISGLCFSTEKTISITINKGKKSMVGKTASAAAVVIAFLLVTIIALLLVIRHFKRRVSVLSQPLSSHLLKTPAESAIKKLQEIHKKHRLNKEDHLVIEKIIQLIACNGLHRVDFVGQRKAGLMNTMDSEVDAFLLDQLAPQAKNEALDQHSILLETVKLPCGEKILDNWAFSVFKYCPDQVLCEVATPIFESHGLFEKFNINQGAFQTWLQGISKGYLNNPYHNVMHAADVVQATHFLLLNLAPSVYERISPMWILSLLFAAVVHDFGHPGVNNNFLYRILDPLALTYNGISILENFHLTESFEFTLHGGSNWLSFFTQQEFIEFHQMVTSLVLATDMSKHVEILSQFTSKKSVNDFDYSHKGDVTLVFQIFIKLADVSNQMRSWDTATKWTHLIMEEFYRQGDQEATHMLTKSAFMDRTAPRVSTCQKAFIQFFVAPLLTAVSAFADAQSPDTEPGSKLSDLQANLTFNANQWKQTDS